MTESQHPEIPQGLYCYTIDKIDGVVIKTKVCPHWGVDSQREVQNNGCCKLTGLKDWIDGTLLWDQIKECGINNE